MLKLRAPIKTSLKSDLLASQENFYERIRGNYMQLGSYIDETDLLHLTTQPPQVFLMNGGMTGMVSNTNQENIQIRKTSIVNNLINRIIVSAGVDMSYQDRVFITNILHKLGIRDERKFMKEIRKTFNEIRQQSEVTDLYWNNVNEIRSLVEEYSQSTEERNRNEISILNENVLHLHEVVNRRLKSAAIYQVLQNFYQNAQEPRTVTGIEYRITQQERFAKEVLLSRLRETAREETAPLVYRTENIYEGDDVDNVDVTTSQVIERISSAILYDMIRNVYENTYERIDNRKQNWLSTEDVYYGAAENTLFRIENNTAYLQYLHEQYEKNEDNDYSYSQEIDLINQLLNLYNSEEYRIQVSRSGDSYRGSTENIRFEGDSFPRSGDTFESTDMTFVTKEGDVDESTEKTENRNDLTEQVYQTYQQNIARNERYMQNLQNIMNRYQVQSSEEKPEERTLRESRLALENPEAFLEQYRSGEEKEEERIRMIERETEKLLPPIQQHTHELIREYLKAPERYRYSEKISVDNMGLLIRDIYEADHGTDLTGEGSGSAEMVYKESEKAPEEEEKGSSYPESGAEDGNVSIVRNDIRNERISETVYSTFLQNIYPVFQSEMILHGGNTTVEMLASAVREHSQELKRRADEGSEAAMVASDVVAGSEKRTEKSFTSVFENNRIQRDEETVYTGENLVVNNITRNILYRLIERSFRTPEPEERYETENVSIIHRSRENTITEETIEDLREEMKRIEETNRTTTESVTNNQHTTSTVINNVTNETIENNDERIQNIVTRQVREQLDSISDKVYGRIERQLRDEQRRRGL